MAADSSAKWQRAALKKLRHSACLAARLRQAEGSLDEAQTAKAKRFCDAKREAAKAGASESDIKAACDAGEAAAAEAISKAASSRTRASTLDPPPAKRRRQSDAWESNDQQSSDQQSNDQHQCPVRALQSACRQRPLEMAKVLVAAEVVREKADALTANDAAFALQALAKLKADVSASEEALRTRLCESSEDLDARGLAIALWALGHRFGSGDVDEALSSSNLHRKEAGPLLRLLASRIGTLIGAMRAMDVSTSLWALARLRATSGNYCWEDLSPRVEVLLAEMKSQELSMSLWALATLGLKVSDSLATAFENACVRLANNLGEQSVSNMLWAIGKLASASPEVLMHPSKNLVSILAARASQLKWDQPRGLANSLGACATLKGGRKHMAELALCLTDLVVDQMAGTDAGEAAWSLGRSKLGVTSRPLLRRCQALAESGSLDWQAIGRIGYALDSGLGGGSSCSKLKSALAARAASVIEEVNSQRDALHKGAAELLLAEATGGPGYRLSSGDRILLVDDGGIANTILAEDLKSKGLKMSWWQRFSGQGRHSSPTPSSKGSPFAAAALRMTSTRAAAEFAIASIAPLLAKGASLWLYGTRLEGLSSAAKSLLSGAGLEGAKVVASKGAFVVLHAVASTGKAKQALLEDWAEDTILEVEQVKLPWRVYPGLFAGGMLDVMTILLLSVVPEPPPGTRLLDFCCGSGSLAAAMRQRQPKLRLTLLDADALALEAAKANVSGSRIEHKLSDAWSEVPEESTFDWILSNPPVHCGLQPDFTVLSALLEGGPRRLRPQGVLWFVTQVYVPVAQLCSSAVSDYSDGRFTVWRVDAPE
eukprot:TRINITY_DN35235_c0_g1_i1.p1 TRINITY_DN35235_c0_g1~~TRINITY_DN35235_c0_g1_i1.p1  ORF type:complete len:828 (-),score=165.11 TRINITY_DN35235_c0_g1_i1:85-2568(-)